jgi:hypothetical protein
MKSIAILSLLFLFVISSVYSQKSIKFTGKSDSILLSVTTIEEANKIFTEMNTLSLFNMNDCNNCEDRANAIAYILNKRGLTVAKFWLFGEGKISTGISARILKSKKCKTWGYHVAVGFLVKNKEKIDTIIIDPGTQKKIISLSNWALPLVQKNEIGHIIVKDIVYYTYPLKNKKFEVDKVWTEKDTNLERTAKGLCGKVFFGPSEKRIRKKLKELKSIE